MSSPFPFLWSPARIGSLELPNRVVLTGHGTLMVKDGRVTDMLKAYYAERAKGGVALMMIGTQQVHPSSPGLGHLLANYDDDFIGELVKLATAIHAEGGRAFGYIGHFGAFAGAYPSPPWAPSPIYLRRFGTYAREMSHDDIRVIVEAHARAAVRNVKAGMDGVEVHAGHGLLLNQFLSPLTNTRTDEYGGSLEKRMRFPLEVLAEVRRAIGPNVPLGSRISGEELIEGGLTVEDMKIVVAGMIEAAQIDFIDVSMGNDTQEISDMLHHPPMGLPSAPYAAIAKAIRETVSIPVIHGTRINTPEVAEELIASGAADFAGMCRALIADPHLPNKARNARTDEIIPCIACEQACIGHLERHQPISCIGNPVTSREGAWSVMRPAARRKRVVVVGGGPAGLEAATVAALRGHDVMLFEATDRLGGALRIAAEAPSRDNWTRLVEMKARAVERAGVDVRLGSRVEAEAIAAEEPDAVVMATGAEAVVPDFSGRDLPHVFTDRAVLSGLAQISGAAVVVDFVDYTSGIGAATFLAERGHAVTLVTPSSRVGNNLERPTRALLHRLLTELGVTTLTDHELVGVDPDSVALRSTDTMAPRRLANVGTVVIAAPPAPRKSLARQLEGRVAELFVIGDCQAPRMAEHAILEGHTVGWTL